MTYQHPATGEDCTLNEMLKGFGDMHRAVACLDEARQLLAKHGSIETAYAADEVLDAAKVELRGYREEVLHGPRDT